MMRVVVATVLMISCSAAAYAACKPVLDCNKPVVCIDRNTGAPDRNEACVNSGKKIKFKWTQGGRIKVTFDDPSLFSSQSSGNEATAVAKSFTAQQRTDYTVEDPETGKTSDPTVIIEPLAPEPIFPGGHRGKKKD